MKNTTFKRRIDNAFDAFLADENAGANNSITHAGDSRFSRGEQIADSGVRADALVNILKQTCLFFPGTFILFIISYGFSVLAVNNPYHATPPAGRMFSVALWFAAAVFMTWFGIGDLRKPKHFAVPLSIIATGVVFGLSVGILSAMSSELQHFVWTNALPLYLFPFALMIPFLAKGLVDRE